MQQFEFLYQHMKPLTMFLRLRYSGQFFAEPLCSLFDRSAWNTSHLSLVVQSASWVHPFSEFSVLFLAFVLNNRDVQQKTGISVQISQDPVAGLLLFDCTHVIDHHPLFLLNTLLLFYFQLIPHLYAPCNEAFFCSLIWNLKRTTTTSYPHMWRTETFSTLRL